MSGRHDTLDELVFTAESVPLLVHAAPADSDAGLPLLLAERVAELADLADEMSLLRLVVI